MRRKFGLGSLKNLTFEGGGHEKAIYKKKNCLKSGYEQSPDLR